MFELNNLLFVFNEMLPALQISHHSEGCSCFSYSAYNILFRATLIIHNTAKISDGVHFLQRIWFYFETVLAFCICLEYLDLFVVQILRPISAVLSSNMDNLSSICWWLCDKRAMSSGKLKSSRGCHWCFVSLSSQSLEGKEKETASNPNVPVSWCQRSVSWWW